MKSAAILLSAISIAAVAAAQIPAQEQSSSGRDWSEIYLAESPSVSPDGSFFVFAWCGRIWSAPTSGGMAIPLGDGDGSEKSPVLSPDGKKVAFLSSRAGADMPFELSLGADGLSAGGLRQLSFHTQGCVPCAYSSDGLWLLATAFRDNSSESVTSVRNSRRAILVPLAARGAEAMLFDAPAYTPALSPDGRKVLFVDKCEGGIRDFRKRRPGSSSSFAGEIWLYDRDSGKFSAMVTGRDGAYDPIWAPGGESFYYLSGAGGIRNVRCRDLKSGEDRAITAFSDDHVRTPSLSRDGRTMVFCKGLDFWWLDPTAKKPVATRIAVKPAGFDPASPRTVRHRYSNADNNYGLGNYAFLPDGKGVAFTAGGDVWAMELSEDEKKRRPVLIHGMSRTHERDCSFSPDGETLYYLSDHGDGADVWRTRRADPSLAWWKNVSFVRERIVSGDVCRRSLSVSPDGASLAWADLAGRLSFADTNGVVRHVAPLQSSDCYSYVWSPDGRYVAATLRDGYGNCDVWIIPTWAKEEDGSPTPAPYNVSRNYDWDGDPTWSSDGRVLAFSGKRAASGRDPRIFYVYLDPEDEAHEKAELGVREGSYRVVFDGLFERVRNLGMRGEDPLFAPDGRTLAWNWNGKTWKAKITDNKDKEMFGKLVLLKSWTKTGGDKKDEETILGILDGLPARGDKSFGFTVYQTIDVADWQELAFLIAWADMRDGFCDPATHGTDWQAVREKYRLAARNAPAWSVFAHVMEMMYGEVDGSHFGFWANNATRSRWIPTASSSDWKPITSHLGARFDPDWKGEGWRVKDVIRDSPADRGREGLLAGDIVLSVDGKDVFPGMDYAEAMTVPLPHKFTLSVKRDGETNSLTREVEGVNFSKARQLLRAAEVVEIRKHVREKGNFGYLAIDAMRDDTADAFTDAVFAECFGKDGVIIDVRFNTGGHTADRLIDILCGRRHVRTLYRGVEDEGYIISRFGRPVITSLPVVVLANERSQSNAEEFTHAMKTLGRAKVVGTETAGDVIGTFDLCLLDYGVMRRPRIGFFLPDGTDMECHGAKPDIEVETTPADIAAGRDPQLDAAVDALAKEAAARKAAPPPPLKYAR